MSFVKKYRNLVVVSVVIALVIIVFYLIYPVVLNKLVFRVASTNPKNNSSLPIETQAISIRFSRELAPDYLPQIDFGNEYGNYVNDLRVDKNSLIISLASLDIDKQYSLTLRDIKSVSGEIIQFYKYSFKTKYVEFKNLDKKTQKASIENDKPIQSDPIYSYLPYEDVNTSITARSSLNEAGQETIIISVVITLSKADLANDNGEAAFNKYKTSANNYLLGTGLDLKKYTISYKKQTF